MERGKRINELKTDQYKSSNLNEKKQNKKDFKEMNRASVTKDLTSVSSQTQKKRWSWKKYLKK